VDCETIPELYGSPGPNLGPLDLSWVSQTHIWYDRLRAVLNGSNKVYKVLKSIPRSSGPTMGLLDPPWVSWTHHWSPGPTDKIMDSGLPKMSQIKLMKC
jgi:hypothetical protein